jgi:hypothetical protein
MSSAAQRFDQTLSRFDRVLDERTRLEEARLDRERLVREADRAARQRDNAEQRRQIAARYDDSFKAFGTTVPEAADDEPAGAYRRRLFNRLARKLASDHELAQVRADDLGGQPIVFDNFEAMLLQAAKAEGERPSIDNLPSNGALVARHRTDDMGSRVTEWFGKQSFIADMGRPGRRVVRIVDRRSGQVIWGQPFPSAR